MLLYGRRRLRALAILVAATTVTGVVFAVTKRDARPQSVAAGSNGESVVTTTSVAELPTTTLAPSTMVAPTTTTARLVSPGIVSTTITLPAVPTVPTTRPPDRVDRAGIYVMNRDG